MSRREKICIDQLSDVLENGLIVQSFFFLFFLMILQIGIQHKPNDLKIKTTNLVLVNVLKDQVC